MRAMRELNGIPYVALRKESVDRNLYFSELTPANVGSLSARRAWIEIELKEAKDGPSLGRSPQGERG